MWNTPYIRSQWLCRHASVFLLGLVVQDGHTNVLCGGL